MALSANSIRKQLKLAKPFLAGRSLKTIRIGQNMVGELMELKYKDRVIIKRHDFNAFEGAWVMPKDERRQGVILYLHGGGYTCGGLEYALGFGSTLAEYTGAKVFCAAYRLAPEHKFPAAVEDSLEAYRYLLDKGYAPEHISFCGESAGGGLCYAVCIKAREEGLPMPCGIIAISPWTDLTASGESYGKNKEIDPTMTVELLDLFAEHYTPDRYHPLCSPLFADLHGMPPSLIFVGSDEIMLDDAVLLQEGLLQSGCKSRLIVGKDRWHGYLLYGLEEDYRDFAEISRFLDQVMAEENKLRWLKLDNAAKIYPAALRPGWSNVFRLSMTLSEKVDTDVLQRALDVTVRRFPSIAARLRKGMFWYYLQQLSKVPDIREDKSYPLTPMSYAEIRKCAFRVLVYENRIATEFFHSLTDGNGGLIFLKSLVAEYLQQRYNIRIPAQHGVLGRLEEPSEEELEDSFGKNSGALAASRKENTAWQLSGTPEENGFLHLTCFTVPVKEMLDKAHEYKVSLTNFLTAVMMQALQQLQKDTVPDQKKRRPVKVLIPVNLRKLFDSKTLRNFAMYTTPEILPQLGEYSFEEICDIIKHKMGAEITKKQMSMKIEVNVKSERFVAVRVMPLFIKNMVMKAVFDSVGECKSCLSLSNLGAVQLPQEMKPYVKRMDFILGVQAAAPYNCGVLSYEDTLYINFIRNIKEPNLETYFYRVLRELGICPTVQSNRSEE